MFALNGTPAPPLLEARDLCVRAPGMHRWNRATARELLRGVNLCLHRAQALAVVGESGAGKSTLVRALLRLQRPAAGQVLIDGQDLAILSPSELRAQRRRVQIVFQDPIASLNPALNVLQLVTDPLRAGTSIGPALRERALLQLQTVGLGAQFLGRRPAELSGGQAQRVALARALITEPELLICDEPVSALDLALRAQILQLLQELRLQRSLALLLVTHDLHAARLLCERTLVLRAGAVVEQGDTVQVFGNPAADYTRELLASMLSVKPVSRSVS